MNYLDTKYDNQINKWELFESIIAYWKVFVVSGVLGVLLAAGIYSLTSYTAKATIMNNMAIDYITAKNLKVNLPMLVGKILKSKGIKKSNELKELRKLTYDNKTAGIIFNLKNY